MCICGIDRGLDPETSLWVGVEKVCGNSLLLEGNGVLLLHTVRHRICVSIQKWMDPFGITSCLVMDSDPGTAEVA